MNEHERAGYKKFLFSTDKESRTVKNRETVCNDVGARGWTGSQHLKVTCTCMKDLIEIALKRAVDKRMYLLCILKHFSVVVSDNGLSKRSRLR